MHESVTSGALEARLQASDLQVFGQVFLFVSFIDARGGSALWRGVRLQRVSLLQQQTGTLVVIQKILEKVMIATTNVPASGL